MLCDVIWCHTTNEGAAMVWAAIIALIPAIAAIYAAYRVGMRQGDILVHQADLQANIASAMLEVEQLKLRSDLFDRRFAVYEATRNWLLFTADNERPPALNEGEEGQLYRDFQAARDVARFVFPRNVFETLEAIRLLGNGLAIVNRRLDKDEDVGPALEEHLRLLTEIRAHIDRMRDLFGAEMNLASLRDNQAGGGEN